jgi:acid stress-induced BolA-like protein IbaG/YrbA
MDFLFSEAGEADITGDGVNYYTIDKNIETKAHIKRQMIFDA